MVSALRLETTIEAGSERIAGYVQRIRDAMDVTGVTSVAKLRRFDSEAAHELYRLLLGKVEPLLEGAKEILVVPDGPLRSLPFGVLLRTQADVSTGDLTDYSKYDWLVRRHAVTVLPEVASLRYLRGYQVADRPPDPFVGLGDPVLSGEAGDRKGLEIAKIFMRGGKVDLDSIRGLPRLPETAREITQMARALRAEDDTVFLGAMATEERVKSMDLARYQTIGFATHALLAGDFPDLAEPALVLTPPAEATEEDDGLLTASEVATLRLNTDWVVLSACNTAAPDGTPGAEGFSGLTKAFFYAGARSLLVSHWAVNSDAGLALVTGIFQSLEQDPSLGRAEALRRSMIRLMDDPERTYFSHPVFWAPFTFIGQGI